MTPELFAMAEQDGLQPDGERALSFLRMAHPQGPWTLFAVYPNRKEPETTTYTVDEFVMAKAWMEASNRRGKNFYVLINEVAPGERPTVNPGKDAIRRCTYLHVDIDPEKGAPLKEERERIMHSLVVKRPKSSPQVEEPTFVVDSGGGFQGWYRLESPVDLDGSPEQFKQFERYNKWLESVFGADTCSNVNRVFRIPGLINWVDEGKLKKGRRPALARLVGGSHKSYALTDFGQAKADKTLTEQSINAIQATPLNDIADLDKLGVPARLQWLVANGHPGRDPIGWRECGHYQPDEKDPNDRSDWVIDVCTNMIRCGVPSQLVLGIIVDARWPISEHVLDPDKNGGNALKYAKRQIKRALGFAIKAEETEEDAEERNNALVEMNEQYALLDCGGKARIVRFDQDSMVFMVPEAFKLLVKFPLVSVTDKDGAVKLKSRSDWWLGQSKRRQYQGIRLEPGKPQGDQYLNPWRDPFRNAAPGDWSLMKRHIRDVVCCRNDEHYQYLIRWMAWAMQHPDEPAQVAVILIGEEGTGKSILGSWLRKAFGVHGKLISNPKQLTGDFNALLADAVFLFADEAFNCKDKKANSQLKALITENKFTLENKGLDAVMVDNYLHIMMASNYQHVIPAGLQARRYLVLNVSNEKIQNADYFAPLWEGVKNGGVEAMVHELLNMNLTGWSRFDVPKTEALKGQQADNLHGVQDLVFKMLQSGVPDGAVQTKPGKVAPGGVFIATDLFIKAHELPLGDRQQVAKYLKWCCPAVDSFSGLTKPRKEYLMDGGRASGIELPPLSEARSNFNSRCTVEFTYSSDAIEWDTPWEQPVEYNDRYAAYPGGEL